MRYDRTRPTNRPWRRRDSNPSADPAAVFRELQRRRLSTLKDCRLAWEHSGDLLAVCVAVTKCRLPRWLADALLVILTDEARGGPPVVPLRKGWKSHYRDALDAVRAQTAAVARIIPNTSAPARTWESARILAEAFVRGKYHDLETVSPEAIKKSYRLVCQRIQENPGRYYFALGFQDRLRQALQSLVRTMEASLARQRDQKRE